jgi:hypothetical protein
MPANGGNVIFTKLRALHPAIAALPMAAAMAVLGPALDASAATAAMSCTQSNDCHSQAEDDMGHNNGMSGDIDLSCLSSPTRSDYVTNEMWDVTGTGPYWVEVGVIDGYGPPNSSSTHSRAWFWADNRPSTGFNVHFPGLSIAHRNTVYPASITYQSRQTWSIFGGDSYVSMGLSTSQPNNTIAETAGTEFSDAHGLRDSGSVSNLLWEGRHNHWNSWGHGGHADPPAGPNNHIKATYSRSGSYVKWDRC